MRFRPPVEQVDLTDDRDAELGRERRDLGGVIGMAMGEQQVRGPADRLAPPLVRKGRVAVEERVEQQHRAADLDAKACVAEPDDLHGRLPPGFEPGG